MDYNYTGPITAAGIEYLSRYSYKYGGERKSKFASIKEAEWFLVRHYSAIVESVRPYLPRPVPSYYFDDDYGSHQARNHSRGTIHILDDLGLVIPKWKIKEMLLQTGKYRFVEHDSDVYPYKYPYNKAKYEVCEEKERHYHHWGWGGKRHFRSGKRKHVGWQCVMREHQQYEYDEDIREVRIKYRKRVLPAYFTDWDVYYSNSPYKNWKNYRNHQWRE